MTTEILQARIRARRVEQFAREMGLSRVKVYGEIKAGRLRALKSGRCTLITDESADAYVRLLEAESTISPRTTAAATAASLASRFGSAGAEASA